jgi:hypothetical protein
MLWNLTNIMPDTPDEAKLGSPSPQEPSSEDRVFKRVVISIGLLAFVLIVAFFYASYPGRSGGSNVVAASTPAASEDSTPVAEEATDEPAPIETPKPAPTPVPAPDYYTGKIADLPAKAQAVLKFEPAESSNQVNSAAIVDRVIQACGEASSDYTGSGSFPGKIFVSEVENLGWVRVSWFVPHCDLKVNDGDTVTRFDFKISGDEEHIKFGNMTSASGLLMMMN